MRKRLLEALGEVPIIDVHTHLVGGSLGARGLHDILLYHMAVSDLYAAGCPSGKRLTEYPGWPDPREAHARIEEALPYLPLVQNTSTSWMIRMILADLYDWHEPITAANWRRLDAMIAERSPDADFHHGILDRLNIRRTGTEWARRESGVDDGLLQYALEWAFFTRCQWGEYDTALYELERCWGKSPGPASPIGTGNRPVPDREISSLDDVREAVAHYVGELARLPILSTATHISTDIDLTPVDDGVMETALKRRGIAGTAERNTYAAYINELFLSELARCAPHVVFQFSLAAEPLPRETASRLGQHTIAQLASMISRHPGVQFQCFLASRHANQSLCTLCRELPNFSLSGYWWHNFFLGAIEQVMEERLDMLPLNRQVGFFSDAYCVEWVYGKALLVRKCMAHVLAKKVKLGQYSEPQALAIARSILFESPQALLGFEPRSPRGATKT